MDKRNITLITMGAGNVLALKKTLESFKNICTEVIYGDLLIFEEDREIVKSYQSEYNIKIVPFEFNYIFKNGFSSVLNELSTHTTNDLVLYMNTSEVVDGEERIVRLINEIFWDYNCFSFDHATDKHSWFRLYDKNAIKWGGLIHEELVGDRKDCPYYVFRMKDEEKDLDNSFKAKVFNSIKEIVYFEQYIKLVEYPELKGITNEYWVRFAKENYESMKDRLSKKGKLYEAFKLGDFNMLLDDINNNPEFEKEQYISSVLVDFQGDRKQL